MATRGATAIHAGQATEPHARWDRVPEVRSRTIPPAASPMLLDWGRWLGLMRENIQVDPLRLGVIGELRLDILPGKRIDLDLVKSLQCQPARQTAGPMGGRP